MNADSIVDEVWAPVEGWPYEVSNLGRLRRAADSPPASGTRPGRLVKLSTQRHGYLCANLSKNGDVQLALIHRLVCTAFHGPPPSADHEVAHYDGDPGNASAKNLRWATPLENSADTIRHGRSMRGTKCKQAVLDEASVLDIRARWKAGESAESLAHDYRISRSHASAVARGAEWTWLKP